MLRAEIVPLGRTARAYKRHHHTMTLDELKARWDVEIAGSRRRTMLIWLAGAIGRETGRELGAIADAVPPKKIKR